MNGMAAWKVGDRVRIATRAQTADDVKSGLYYAHYGGLTGAIQKVYENREVAVEVELESLPREIRKRHDTVRDQMKTKWLDGLSEEGRSKLTEREKDFRLRYIVLVGAADLEKTGAAPKPVEPPLPEAAPQRKTLAEIEAAEEAELRLRSPE